MRVVACLGLVAAARALTTFRGASLGPRPSLQVHRAAVPVVEATPARRHQDDLRHRPYHALRPVSTNVFLRRPFEGNVLRPLRTLSVALLKRRWLLRGLFLLGSLLLTALFPKAAVADQAPPLKLVKALVNARNAAEPDSLIDHLITDHVRYITLTLAASKKDENNPFVLLGGLGLMGAFFLNTFLTWWSDRSATKRMRNTEIEIFGREQTSYVRGNATDDVRQIDADDVSLKKLDSYTEEDDPFADLDKKDTQQGDDDGKDKGDDKDNEGGKKPKGGGGDKGGGPKKNKD